MSDESQVTVKHTTQQEPLRCMPHKPYTSGPMITQVLKPFIVSLNTDPQATACFSECHNDDHSLMPIKDVRSDGYALGTMSSEELCTSK